MLQNFKSRKMSVRNSFLLFFSLLALQSSAQLTAQQKTYTRADTLRGSLNEERTWWDVTHYAITVQPDYGSRSISGSVTLSFRVLSKGTVMQIDLQQPLEILRVMHGDRQLGVEREGNAWHVRFPSAPATGSMQSVRIDYAGKPVVAVRPPWDGGWIFTRDPQGRPWMSVACQGLGASVWYPCKDHQSDEPDSASMSITVPDTLMAVSNGRLRAVTKDGRGLATYDWAVTSPINSYNLVPYIGRYVSWNETYPGESGKLDCSYYVLEQNLTKAKQQFTQVAGMLRCFERWFGPYPFYADGYKLVESPHLGMEHQSAVAYGNGYMNGYRGTDLSRSGWGLKWDFIIIHESGHEWFGNNITSKDIADMWIHEGFTNYSETVFTECLSGKDAGSAYVRGTRQLIRNDIPVVGRYGVNEEGSGDMYYKGGNMIHYMRQLFRDDERFRMALRAMNDSFRHATVSYADIVGFWSLKAGRDLSPLFRQYLTTTQIPILTWKASGKKLSYAWKNCIPDYNIPVKVIIDGKEERWLEPTTKIKTLRLPAAMKELQIHPDFYAQQSKTP
jgi:aminopeptidase N